MSKQNYAITLDTPLGIRNGTLELEILGTKIDGYLSIFRSREFVIGELADDGTCRLSGKFTTLMREFFYEATGHISRDNIALTLRSRQSVFPLKGVAIPQTEQVQGDES